MGRAATTRRRCFPAAENFPFEWEATSPLPIGDVVAQFAVVVAAVLVVQLGFERSRLPGIIGLPMLGMMIGPGGLGVLEREPVVELFGSVGLLYIMLVAGVEIDLGTVRRHKSESVTFGILAFAATFAPSAAAGLVMGLEPAGAILLVAALSSHTLGAYPTVNQLGLARHRPIVAATGGTLPTAHSHTHDRGALKAEKAFGVAGVEQQADAAQRHQTESNRKAGKDDDPSWLGHPSMAGRPAILLGDFNAGPRSAPFKLLAKELVEVQDLSPDLARPTFPSLFAVLRIDHIFGCGLVVADAKVIDEGLARRASDHLPLIATLHLP